MATAAQTLRDSPAPLVWIREFLREELAPYSGRAGVVVRMVFSATLVMILCMTLRLPYGFQGAIYALLLTRESPRATLRSSVRILIGTGISAAYILFSAYLVISVPSLYFLWILLSLFVAFYLLSAMTDYATSTTFAIAIAVSVPLWDRHVPAGTNVEDTLWVTLSLLVGVLVTTAVELAVARRKPGDEIISPLAHRLTVVEELLMHLAETGAVDDATKKNVIRYAMLGTSRLRRLLRRSNYSTHYNVQMNGVVGPVGRLVDTAATLTEFRFEPSDSDRKKFRDLAGTIATVRADLSSRRIPGPVHFSADAETSLRLPLLHEIEDLVSLIPQAFGDSKSMGEYLPSSHETAQPKLLRADAFTSTQHAKFALKGCLAAGACYMIYNAVDWPGISTAVTTCLLTALSTIGSSRQKQVLRFTGAIVGGFVLGMGSQIFVLPHLDSIFGFTLLFIAVTALASWIMTSSSRLSYFGVQVAFAFYLINLQEFAIVTSLAIARDRVVGVLLGLLMMWLIFDQLWGAPATVEMKKAMADELRLVAQLAREPVSNDGGIALARALSLRETINENFDNARAMADAALLEFGPSRQQDLTLRKRILEGQSRLRTLFLTSLPLWKYRGQLPKFELPKEVLQAQREFDNQSAETLDAIADRVEGKSPTRKGNLEASFEHLEQVASRAGSQQGGGMPAPQVQAVLALSGRINKLTIWLDQNI